MTFNKLLITQLLILSISGYLSCCRFLDDNQIVTSSGDTTWWVKGLPTYRCITELLSNQHFNAKTRKLEEQLSKSCVLFLVHFGTLRLASKQPHLLDTQVMSWACRWPLTHGYSSLVLVMPLLNSGTFERACADRHLLAMNLTSMPSV